MADPRHDRHGHADTQTRTVVADVAPWLMLGIRLALVLAIIYPVARRSMWYRT